MSRTSTPSHTYFTLDGDKAREVAGWRRAKPGVSWTTNAKNYARRNGCALVWKANGSLVMFYKVGDKVRQQAWDQATPTSLLK